MSAIADLWRPACLAAALGLLPAALGAQTPLGLGADRAQPAPAAEKPLDRPGDRPSPLDCGSAAAAYVGPKDLRLWVTRKGTLTQDNPLRPLTKDRFVLLQLVVNGRVASAYGPDYDHLQRAGAPQDIEPPVPKVIAWDPAMDAVPQTIRVVRDDGTPLLGPITFSACGQAPRVAAPVAAKRPRKPPRAAEPPTGLQLPQGAIP